MQKPLRSKDKRAILRKMQRDARKYNLCKCAPETRLYKSKQEVEADTAPAEVCSICGKSKLILAAIAEGKQFDDLASLPDVKREA